jgi:hypothetical protein
MYFKLTSTRKLSWQEDDAEIKVGWFGPQIVTMSHTI